MFWQITSFPRCEHHVFLSHCAADRPGLVEPVYEELKRRAITPWLDRDDYYYGRDSRTALRDGLLRSRHVVFFITVEMMDYRRGWCFLEVAYSNLIRSNLVHPMSGSPLLNYELPLFFLDRNNPELPRTAWNELRDRGRFHLPSDGDAVAWAVDQIVEFLRREQRLALEMAKVLAPRRRSFAPWHGVSAFIEALMSRRRIEDPLASRPGLIERVTQFDPSAIA